MILKYYSDNIRVPDFTQYEESEIVRILFSVDTLVLGAENAESHAREYTYKKDDLILTIKEDDDLLEYRVGVIVDSRPVEVFCAYYSNASANAPIYTVMRYNAGNWSSKLWDIATKNDDFVATIERFSRI